MAKKDSTGPGRLPSCRACGDPVGIEAKAMPVMVSPHEAPDDPARRETWCPQCFVFVRAQEEPGRWPRIAPRACSRCGVDAVDFGTGTCPACRSPFVGTLVLAPKGMKVS